MLNAARRRRQRKLARVVEGAVDVQRHARPGARGARAARCRAARRWAAAARPPLPGVPTSSRLTYGSRGSPRAGQRQLAASVAGEVLHDDAVATRGRPSRRTNDGLRPSEPGARAVGQRQAGNADGHRQRGDLVDAAGSRRRRRPAGMRRARSAVSPMATGPRRALDRHLGAVAVRSGTARPRSGASAGTQQEDITDAGHSESSRTASSNVRSICVAPRRPFRLMVPPNDRTAATARTQPR